MPPTVCLRCNRLPWLPEPRESTEPEPRLNIRAKNGFFGLLPDDEGEDGERGVREEGLGMYVCTLVSVGTCGAFGQRQ